MNKNRVLVLSVNLMLAASALGLSACNGPGQDFYSQVIDVCATQDPNMGNYFPNKADIVNTYLTPQCKAALEGTAPGTVPSTVQAPSGVIPFDIGSFATAPTGMMDKVAEGFQAILAYPLSLTMPGQTSLDSTYLGVEPAIAGAISPFTFQTYQESGNPNQALFNYILNQVDAIVYNGPMGGTEAQYTLQLSLKNPRIIYIYDAFWNYSDPNFNYRDSFARAAILSHEAHHGDGTFHTQCSTTNQASWACDDELQGAYGFGGTYLKFLLQGSAISVGGKAPVLPAYNTMVAGWAMCNIALYNINDPFPELVAVTTALGSCYSASYDWTMKQMNLPAYFTGSSATETATAIIAPGLVGGIKTPVNGIAGAVSGSTTPSAPMSASDWAAAQATSAPAGTSITPPATLTHGAGTFQQCSVTSETSAGLPNL